MQKKVIALAVAGLVSGAAFAQSNVTLWGIIDVGVAHSWDANRDHAKNLTEVKAGGLNKSRVGVKGVEDLGNGLKAEFDATWAFNADINDTVSMGKGSSVALSGKFGKIRAGAFSTFQDENTAIDVSQRGGIINNNKLYDTDLQQNFVAYYSPVFSGLQFKAGFASNVADYGLNAAQDVSPLADTGLPNTRAYSAAVTYANGPVNAGVAYSRYKAQEAYGYTGSNDASYDWNAAVSYDFGVAKASLHVARQKAGDAVLPNSAMAGLAMSSTTYDKKSFWALSAAVPVTGSDTIIATYGRAKLNGVDRSDVKGTVAEVMYLHSFSKRTDLYALYGTLGGDIDENSYGATAYTQAVQFGLRHKF